MRRRWGIGRATMAAAFLVLLAGCDEVASLVPADRLQCGGTERDLCEAVAALAVQQMNLQATGPITDVALTEGGCEQVAQSSFVPVRDADRCWRVDVTGEDSFGGGIVALWPDGDLRAFW